MRTVRQANPHHVRELVIYVENTREFYVPIWKKQEKLVRDANKTFDLERYIKHQANHMVKLAAQKYTKDYANENDVIFSVQDRLAASREICEDIQTELNLGNFWE